MQTQHKKRPFIKAAFLLLMLYMAGATGAAGWVLITYSTVKLGDLESRSYDYETMGAQEHDHEVRVFSPNLRHLASREVSDIVAADNNVIIMLGDSMFYGLGVKPTETLYYHLNRLDPAKKYINLALPGANVRDSVERFHRKVGEGQRPSMIVFQLLLDNDVAASQYMEELVGKRVDRDYRYILFPFSVLLPKERLIRFYLYNVWEAIFADLTDERFEKYFKRPLERLMSLVPPGTKLVMISYSEHLRFNDYHRRLRLLMQASRMSLLSIAQGRRVQEEGACEGLAPRRPPDALVQRAVGAETEGNHRCK